MTYLQRLSKVVNEPGFKRLFLTTCKDCGKKIWSLDERVDVDKGVIKAKFWCDCGAKYMQTAYSRDSDKAYRLTQGLVTDYPTPTQVHRVIKTNKALFFVSEKGIKVKRLQK